MAQISVEKQMMLADYKSCLDILRHEDGRKSHLFSVFLVLQGVLFGFYGSVFEKHQFLSFVIIGIAFFLCILWFFVMERMKGFIDLRYFQGRKLEEHLDGLKTVTMELTLREKGKVTMFDEEFKLRRHQRIFSISKHVESSLPILTGIIWLGVLLTAIFFDRFVL